MAVGLQPTKADVDTLSGRVCRAVNIALEDVMSFKFWLASKTDAQLIAMGYVQAEVDVLRSAFNDLDQLRAVYQGLATQASAVDFRAFPKQLFGFGFIS